MSFVQFYQSDNPDSESIDAAMLRKKVIIGFEYLEN